MPHYYIPKNNIIAGKFELEKDESHHLIEVKRCKKGSKIQLFDGEGTNYLAEVGSIVKGIISGIILGQMQSVKSLTEINLCTAIPKGDRFDWLIEKASEIGVKAIIPVITKRSIIKEISANKAGRWARLSQAASKQCGRSDIMSIAKPVDFFEIVSAVPKNSANIIPWEAEDSKSIKEAAGILQKSGPGIQFNIFIGPEGGFTIQEIEFAKKAGIISVALGPNILRVETAAIVSATICFCIAGEFERRPGQSRSFTA